MTRSERLWNDGHKFSCFLPNTGTIVTYQEMNATPCTYFGSCTVFVNGEEVNVDLYYKDNEQGYIGVIGSHYDYIKVLNHKIA